MTKPLNTVLIGCGQIALGYGFDQQYARFYKYATHAQVLAAHPDFRWVAAIDPSDEARALIKKTWAKVTVAASLKKLPRSLPPLDAAIIATPPSIRLKLLKQLSPSIKIILVEKPIGQTVKECQKFLAYCRQKNILVQVNLWRRADELHRQLAAGKLRKHIGDLQGINIIYDGNLHNTATHLIDLIEMMAGPISSVQASTNNSCVLRLRSGVIVTLLALNPKHYRELTVDFWGTRGRLTISQEDLHIEARSVKSHRVLRAAKEIPTDNPGKKITPTVGGAYYHLYTNLAAAYQRKQKLWAPGELALRAAQVIAKIKQAT